MAVARGQGEGGMNRQNTVLRQKKAIVDAVMSGYTSKPIGCPLPAVALM